MVHYLSHRHELLMDESEQALSDAVQSKSNREARIAKHILNDSKMHRLWEARHADIVKPVAEQKKRMPQVFQLRNIEISLLHKRALIDHIRHNQLRGKERDQMIAAFYGPRDIIDAIVAEHQQYMLAVSSCLSTVHLINIMHDPVSNRLLRQYKLLFTEYFDLYGYTVRSQDAISANTVRPMMIATRKKIARLRQRIDSEQPVGRYGDLDSQASLARSGRYPVLDYMVG